MATTLDALDADHEFLLEGDVFTPDAIATWQAMKRTRDLPAVNRRPHPYEFFLTTPDKPGRAGPPCPALHLELS